MTHGKLLLNRMNAEYSSSHRKRKKLCLQLHHSLKNSKVHSKLHNEIVSYLFFIHNKSSVNM